MLPWHRYYEEIQAARVYDKTSFFLYGNDAVTNFGIEAASADSITLPSNVYHIKARYDRWRAENPKQLVDGPQVLFAPTTGAPSPLLLPAPSATLHLPTEGSAMNCFSEGSSSFYNTGYLLPHPAKYPRHMQHQPEDSASALAGASFSLLQGASSSANALAAVASGPSPSPQYHHVLESSNSGYNIHLSPYSVTASAAPVMGTAPVSGVPYMLVSPSQALAGEQPRQVLWVPSNHSRAAAAASAEGTTQHSPYLQQLHQEQLSALSTRSAFAGPVPKQLLTPEVMQQQTQPQQVVHQQHPVQLQPSIHTLAMQPQPEQQQKAQRMHASGLSHQMLLQPVSLQPGSCYHQDQQQQQQKVFVLAHGTGLQTACTADAAAGGHAASMAAVDVQGLAQHMGTLDLRGQGSYPQLQQQHWVAAGGSISSISSHGGGAYYLSQSSGGGGVQGQQLVLPGVPGAY
jgi:hypothetical protein